MDFEISHFYGDSISQEEKSQLAALFKELDDEEVVRNGELGMKMTDPEPGYFEEKIGQDGGFVAFHDGKAVGMVSNVPADEYSNVMYVSRLIVTKEFRRNGIGRALMEHVLKFNQARKKRTMLVVSAWNDAASALYDSLGFLTYSRTLYT